MSISFSAGCLIALGWDVGGWQGRAQATAVARFGAGEHRLEWLGISEPFRFRAGMVPGFEALAVPAVGAGLTEEIQEHANSVVAIDAPLSFPPRFRQLLSGTADPVAVPEREIDNRLAFRACDRWVWEQFGKKPLSASFDRLGNNATLAMTVAGRLEERGFALVPQTVAEAPRAIIEVYPGLAKTTRGKGSPAIESLARHLPEGLAPGSDRYDAAICALLGLAFGGAVERLDIPELLQPPERFDVSEGWIYAPGGSFD